MVLIGVERIVKKSYQTMVLIWCDNIDTNTFDFHIGIIEGFVKEMPFASIGFGLVVPCIVGFIAGPVVYPVMKPKQITIL